MGAPDITWHVSAIQSPGISHAREKWENTLSPHFRADVADVTAAADVAHVADVTALADAADLTDLADVADVADVTDVADVADVADATDLADVTDAVDVAGVADVADVADVGDVTDATNATDVADRHRPAALATGAPPSPRGSQVARANNSMLGAEVSSRGPGDCPMQRKSVLTS